MGAEVALVARVGADVFGDASLRSIQSMGVDTRYVVSDPDHPSGVALIVVDRSGQNSIVVAPGANHELRPADVDAALPALEACDVVVLQLEAPIDTVHHAIRAARRLDKLVVLNPAPSPPPDLDLAGVDFLTPNETEACQLLGLPYSATFDDLQVAQQLVDRRLPNGFVILTVGSRGAVVASMAGQRRIATHRVDAVDTTAAGDCFTGALATALGEGLTVEQATRFANAAAALSVTRMGAQTSIPSRQEVEALLARF
jgi:ribokinase